MITKKKQEIFLEKIKKIHGDSIEITTTFLGSACPISYKCNICGKTNDVKRAAELVTKKAIKRKHNCRKCFWEYKHTKYRDEAKEKALEKIKKYPNILILKEFRDRKENRLHFKLTCTECNHEWDVNATTNLKRGWKGCPECWMNSDEFKRITEIGRRKSRKKRSVVSKENFFEALKERKSILLIDTYIDASTNLIFQCKTCSNKWETSPSDAPPHT